MYNNPTTTNPPPRTALCPSCKCVATFTYIGEQEGCGEAAFSLWDCSSCGSTFSERSLKWI